MRLKLSFLSLLFTTLLFGFFLPQTALADTSTLSGNVSDSSSADIDGANITVTDSSNNSAVGSTTTDSSGNYSIIVPGGTYNVQVTPQAGSNFSPAIALNQTISSNTVLNFVLTPTGTVVLSGHVYDPLGNPLSGQTVSLQASGGNPITTTTDNNGNYSLQVSSGSYTLDVRADSNSLSLNVPQLYWIQLK